MKLKPLSKSRLSMARKCPWKAHAIKNLGFEEKSGDPAILGQETHALLELHLRGKDYEDQLLEASDEMQWLVAQGLKHIAAVTRPDQSIELVESRIYAKASGKLVGVSEAGTPLIEYEQWSDVSGVMDWVIPHETDVHIIDWKTGRWEKDDLDERHIYAGFLAKAIFPDTNRVIFDRVFLRSGNVLQSQYEWKKKTEVHVTGPDGKVNILQDRKGPINAWMQAVLREIRAMKPKATPGAHCANWYGRPCEFAAQCPANANLPSDLHDDLPDALDAERVSFRKAVMGEPMSSDDAANAYIFLNRVRSLTAAGEAAIKEWARTNGPFCVGDKRFGWKQGVKYEVDKEFALQALFESGLSYDEIASVCSISKTSLKNLKKRDHPTLREVLDNLAVTTEEGKPTFGEITEEANG